MDNPAARIYFGVPRFVGELFRATKTPSIILLIGFLGVPIVITVFLTTYVARRHSILPAQLFIVGFLQFRVESDPASAEKLPPDFAQLLQTMTAEQKQQGKEIFEYFAVFETILAAVFIWWLIGVFRFLVNRATHKPH